MLPVATPPIEDGAVVIRDSTILDFGKRRDILGTYSGEISDFDDSIILPGLVNAHTHLELSSLKGEIRNEGDFVDWIKKLVLKRWRRSPEKDEEAIEQAISEVISTGTVAIGDVTNTGSSVPLIYKSRLTGVIFHELIGFAEDKAYEVFQKGTKLLSDFPESKRLKYALSPHAPYSVSPQLFRQIRERDQIRTVHLCESEEEILFIDTGQGRFKRLLQFAGAWNSEWEIPGTTPVQYLDKLNFWDFQTLAVHVVYPTDEDIQILKKRKVSVCLCPRSNRNLRVGVAPLGRFWDANINVCIGTDSLASVEDLNLFNEMKAMHELYPDVVPQRIVEMATLNGAAALGLDKNMGSIRKGKAASMIAIGLDGRTVKDPYEYLVESVEQKMIEPLWS